jgi:hypothetical protein
MFWTLSSLVTSTTMIKERKAGLAAYFCAVAAASLAVSSLMSANAIALAPASANEIAASFPIPPPA